MNKEILEHFEAKALAKKQNNKAVANERGETVFLNTSAIKPISIDMSEHDSLSVYVLTDLHVSSHESEYEKAERYLSMIKEMPNALVIVNGDLINNATIGSVSDTLAQAENIVPAVYKVRSLLKEINERNMIAVNAPGNHEYRSAKLVAIEPSMLYGVSEDKYAHAIYLLDVKYKTTEGKPAHYRILGSHGEMSKGRPGASVDALLNLAKNTFNGMPDLVVGGHVHQNSMGRNVVFLQNPDLNNKTNKKLITGISVPPLISWEDYAAKKGYNPSNTDNSVYEIIATPDKDNGYINHINTFSLDRLFSENNTISKEANRKIKNFVNKLNRTEDKIYKKLITSNDQDITTTYGEYLVNLFKMKAELEKEYSQKEVKEVKDKNIITHDELTK